LGRRLDWYFIQTIIYGDEWYTWYGKEEIPKDIMKNAGPEDKLRNTDVCPDPITQTYSRESCPPPPDCSQVKQKWGEAALCITRTPFPWDIYKFYVSAMMCKPVWENCDRCQCGEIANIGGPNEYCVFKGTDHQNPSDDRWIYDDYWCFRPERVSVKTEKNGQLNFTPFTHLPTESPTNTPSLPPSEVPSSKPTFSPTRLPTLKPSHRPSMVPTVSRSESPSTSPTTESPSFTPISNAPTLRPSEFPSRYHSSFPSESPTDRFVIAFVDVSALLPNDDDPSTDTTSFFNDENFIPSEDSTSSEGAGAFFSLDPDDEVDFIVDNTASNSELSPIDDAVDKDEGSSLDNSALETTLNKGVFASMDDVSLFQFVLYVVSALCFGSFVILGIYWSFCVGKQKKTNSGHVALQKHAYRHPV